MWTMLSVVYWCAVALSAYAGWLAGLSANDAIALGTVAPASLVICYLLWRYTRRFKGY
jgi:4-hydroxybenzoate polyprenyltransferase